MDKDKDQAETALDFKLMYIAAAILLLAHLSGNTYFELFANLFSSAVYLATITEVIHKKHKRGKLHSKE